MNPSLRHLPSRAWWRSSTLMSEIGLRHDIGWLTYNPATIQSYHRLARRDADAVARAFAAEYAPGGGPPPRTVDVGAGSGAFAAGLARSGWDVVALERSAAGRALGRMQRVRCRRFDLEREPPARLDGRFGLAYCFEVAEHLPPALGDRLVGFLATAAPVVVFSAAPPGQGGLGHINEQPLEYWAERFGRHGHRLDEERSRGIREAFGTAGVDAPWLRANTVVFAA